MWIKWYINSKKQTQIDQMKLTLCTTRTSNRGLNEMHIVLQIKPTPTLLQSFIYTP